MSEGEFRPLRREVQMIFQDPFGSLNPRHTIFQIVGEALEIHFREMNREARRERVSELMKQNKQPLTVWQSRSLRTCLNTSAPRRRI